MENYEKAMNFIEEIDSTEQLQNILKELIQENPDCFVENWIVEHFDL